MPASSCRTSGLFSYDNFENWMYLPSFTSDNTPWFFNGMRLQSLHERQAQDRAVAHQRLADYGKFNEMPGFGAQISGVRPSGSPFSRTTTWGWDAQDIPGLSRWHSDNSVQFSYYHNPKGFVSRVAGSYTFDIGGEFGDGVAFGGRSQEGHCSVPSLCGALHQRNDVPPGVVRRQLRHYRRRGLHVESEPLPGVGADRQCVGHPPAREHPGHPVHPADERLRHEPRHAFPNAWDYEFGFQYMPIEQFTFDMEFNHRQADTPYFSGHGGVTSPDGYITTTAPAGWRADLVKDDNRLIAAWLVRF